MERTDEEIKKDFACLGWGAGAAKERRMEIILELLLEIRGKI